MSKGRQDAGPEWCAICAQVREELIKVCPLSNRRFNNAPGTFRRSQIMEHAGVSLANIRRLVDDQLPGTPDTVIKIAMFLGFRVKLEFVGPRPYPAIPDNSELYKYGWRPGRTRAGGRRRSRGGRRK